MSEPYPLPGYACSIWFTGTGVALSFPPQGDEQKGSTIHIPLERCGIESSDWGEPLASQRGWAVLLTALKQRYAGAKEFRKLSQPGQPSQYEVERALANDKRYATILGALAEAKKISEAEKAEAARELAELGL